MSDVVFCLGAFVDFGRWRRLSGAGVASSGSSILLVADPTGLDNAAAESGPVSWARQRQQFPRPEGREMQFANIGGARVEPSPGTRAACPACSGPVLAKCGEIVTWHWAHEAADCDPWSEPETEWHREWKSNFSPEHREVVMGPHRADVRLPIGRVIEFQHSSISQEEIAEREAFYGPLMVWVLDMTEKSDQVEIRERDGFVSFKWKHARKSFFESRRRILLDLGYAELLDIKKLYPSQAEGYTELGNGEIAKQRAKTAAGWGNVISYAEFVAKIGRI